MRPPVHDEARNFSAAFALLGVAFAAVTVWALWDEGVTRRPWKRWQQAWLDLQPEAQEGIAVRQLVVPELGVVDRCTTCHAGVDDPKLAGPEVPRVLRVHPQRDTLLKHHPPQKFGCTPCHQGQGLALTEETAHGEGDPHWQKPLLRGALVQGACLHCHAEERELAGAPELMAGKRAFAELGCGGCHATGTEERQRRGPSLRHVASKLKPAWMIQWIGQPTQRRARYQMPQFWPRAAREPAEAARRDQEVLAISAYLIQSSEPWPLAEAHTSVDVAGAEAGQDRFDQLGCRGCHALGPGRDEVRIAEPKSAQAAVGDAAWAAFDGPDTEPAADAQEATATAAPAGLAAAATVDFAPPLGDAAGRLRPGFVAAWLQDPSAYWSAARMPTPRVSVAEAGRLQDFLLTPLPDDAKPAAEIPALRAPIDPGLVQRGRELIAAYGCSGCHEIPGFLQDARPGPDLADYGAKDPRDMLFATPPPPRSERTWERATVAKLRAPQALATSTIVQVMPDYALSEQQVQNLSTYLQGLTEDRPPPAWQVAPPGIAAHNLATQVLDERGCSQCHTLDKLAPPIAQFYVDAHLAPPSLDVAAQRLQPAWLFGYLLQPLGIRPWLQVRMPDFRLTEAEAEALTEYLLQRAGHAKGLRRLATHQPDLARAQLGAQLFERLKCVTCHRLQRGDGVETAQLAPDLGLARQRLDPAWVLKFLEDPNKVLPGTKMPQFFPEGQSPAPDVLGGDVRAQMQLLVDYLMNLGLLPVDPPQGGMP